MKVKYNNNSTDKYALKRSNDDKNCVLKFSKCDDKFPLWKLNSIELKQFVDFAKKVEGLSWKDIKKYTGLKYEVLKNFNTPSTISNDIVISSMRVSKSFRIIGFRDNEYLYVIWFDNTHKTC